MYSTLCEKLNQGDAAKVHSLLENHGLHPLTINIPDQILGMDSTSELRYDVKLLDDEIERGRKTLTSFKCDKYLVRDRETTKTNIGTSKITSLEIDQLVKQVCCPEGCACCDLDIKDPLRICYVYGVNISKCLNPQSNCFHCIPFAENLPFCGCPVRKYIAEQCC